MEAKGVYFDLRTLLESNLLDQRYTYDANVQILTFSSKDRQYKLIITLPDQLFEWFIDVDDSNGIRIVHTWIDHYGNSFENLVLEMKEEIQQFLKLVQDCNVRVTDQGKRPRFQYFDGKNWLDHYYLWSS